MKKIKVKIEWTGDNFAAATGEINGVVIVTGKSPDILKKEFESAFNYHIEAALEDGDDLPEFIKSGDYELDFELQVSAILKELDGIITRKAISKVTHINEKQLGHYIQGARKAKPETREKLINGLAKIRKEIESVV